MCSIAGLTVCVVGSIIFAETNEDRFKERGAGKAVSQSAHSNSRRGAALNPSFPPSATRIELASLSPPPPPSAPLLSHLLRARVHGLLLLRAPTAL